MSQSTNTVCTQFKNNTFKLEIGGFPGILKHWLLLINTITREYQTTC